MLNDYIVRHDLACMEGAEGRSRREEAHGGSGWRDRRNEADGGSGWRELEERGS